MAHNVPGQCAHVFEIKYRQCRACDGKDETCRCYETKEKQEERMACNERGKHLAEPTGR